MNTQKTAPDFGEPWILQNEGNNLWVALRDESEVIGDIVCDAPSHEYLASVSHWPDRASRIVSCVNACAGMSDPAAEIQALREAVKEARAFISRMRPSLLNLEHDDYVARYGVSQEYATSEEAISEAISKLRSLL